MSDDPNKCPKCGGPTREQEKFKGLFTCIRIGECNGMVLTDAGAAAFDAALWEEYLKQHFNKN